MSVSTFHPMYQKWILDWNKCRDCYDGQRAVKTRGETYLPKLSAQTSDEYSAYKNRALFYSITSKSVGALVGMAISKSPVIKHPKELDSHFVENSGTQFYEALGASLSEVLLMGRYGLFVDRAVDGGLPEIHGYVAENILNWDVNRDGKATMVVLRENVYDAENSEFTHITKTIYRVLRLELKPNDLNIPADMFTADTSNYIYTVTVYEGDGDGSQTTKIIPTNNGQPMNEIPFYVVNPFGVGFSVAKPPILDIADVNISHYQTSADLEHGRHFTGLPTAVVSGVDASTVLKIGSMTAWVLPDKDAKATFLEFTGQGLKSLENAMKEKENQLASLSARMLGNSSNGSEAADTVRLRYMSETASLSSVARAVEAGLNLAYKMIASMESLDPKDVSIFLDKAFLNTKMSGAELLKMTESYLTGGISVDSYVFNLRRGDLIPTTKSDDEEKADLIEMKSAIDLAKLVVPTATKP
jgi:hypothetical protein